jgi:hypothetical protein
MHVSTALDAIEKRGTFKAYKETCEAYVEQRKVAKQAKAALALLTAPTSKARKNLRRLLQRNPLRRRRLPRRPRKARLWPTHQPQNFARSTRPSTTRPPLQKRPPRTSAKLLPPRCFSSTATCCLWMPSTSLVSLLSPHKINNIFKSEVSLCLHPLWLHWSIPKINFIFVIHLNLAKPITNTLKS